MDQPKPLHPRNLWGKDASDSEIRRALTESNLQAGLFTLCIIREDGRKAWHSFTAFITRKGELRARFGGDLHNSCPLNRRRAIAQKRYGNSNGLPSEMLLAYPGDPKPKQEEPAPVTQTIPAPMSTPTPILLPPPTTHRAPPPPPPASSAPPGEDHTAPEAQEFVPQFKNGHEAPWFEELREIARGIDLGVAVFGSCIVLAIIIAITGHILSHSKAYSTPVALSIPSSGHGIATIIIIAMAILPLIQWIRERNKLGESRYRLRKYHHLRPPKSGSASASAHPVIPLLKSGLFYGLIAVIAGIILLQGVILHFSFNR